MTNLDALTFLPVNAAAVVKISSDGFEATIKISPPENGGTTLSYLDLKILLTQNKITFGLEEDTLKSLGERPVYDTPVVVAHGVPPENGVDAKLVYYIETDLKLKPKEREDGSVDFKELGLIQKVRQGQILCEKIEALPGKPGTTVSGKNIPQHPGRDTALPSGKNTVLSEDKLKLYSNLDGLIMIAGSKINVLNAYIVDGDVSLETGNIDFSGSVIIRGSVMRGFTVRADGDVTVNGVVEAANIIAGGTLVVRGGFFGGDSGRLDITGNVVCRYIEGGEVNVNGDLETTYIINAKITCGGSVNLTGRGLIRGGNVTARLSVNANLLGSSNLLSAPTVIEAGTDLSLIEHYEELKGRLNKTRNKISELEAVVTPLAKARAAGFLASEKVQTLEEAMADLDKLQSSYEELKEMVSILEKQVAHLVRATVNVRKTAYARLKIVIGDASITLESDIERVSFFNTSDGISFKPL